MSRIRQGDDRAPQAVDEPVIGFSILKYPEISTPQAAVAALAQWISTVRRRVEQRRQLNQLPDWQLKDMGLTRDQVRREVHKPWWRD